MLPQGEIRFIVNPVSGRFGNRALVEAFRRRAEAAGRAVTVQRTAGTGDAEAMAREAFAAGVAALVVVGGDGTVREVVNGMTDGGPPILVVPSGTENILAKYLGIRRDAEWLWQVLCEGREIELDVGVHWGGDSAVEKAARDGCPTGRRFLLIAGAGFDAEVVRRLTLERKGHITYWSYFWPVWRSFWSYRQPQVFVEADDRVIFDGRGLVYVGSIPRYAVGMRLLARAVAADGLLDVCVFQCCKSNAVLGGRVTLLRHALNTFLGRHVGTRGVIYAQARRVRVWSKERVPVEIDGDLAGELPQEYGVADFRARFLVGRDWQG